MGMQDSADKMSDSKYKYKYRGRSFRIEERPRVTIKIGDTPCDRGTLFVTGYTLCDKRNVPKVRAQSARWGNFRTWLMIIWAQKQGNEIS